jgi:hypothetical protein
VEWLDGLLCPLAAVAEHYGALALVSVLSGMMGGGILGSGVLRLLARLVRVGAGSFAPGWVASVLIAVVCYVVGIAVDPLLKSTADRPRAIPAEAWERIGFFEWKILGDWSWPFLPLSEHPATGIVVHLALWIAMVLLVRAVLLWLHRDTPIGWSTPEDALPWYYRWVGSTTARRADQRFSLWMKRLLWVGWPVFLLCGYLLASESLRGGPRIPPQCTEDAPAMIAGAVGAFLGQPILGAPPPGAWVLGGLFLLAATVHLMLEGSPPAEKVKPKADEEEALPGPPPDPLRRLGDALHAKVPGAFLEALEQRAPREPELADFRDGESPLVREAFAALTGQEQPYSHQREVLDHLAAVWTMSAPEGIGAAPELREEVGPAPIREAELSTPHALVLAPEGSGRTTLSCLSALYVHLDRGATTLVIAFDLEAARAWAKRLREALVRSSARWNVQVVVAGEDMADAFLAGRTPAVVVAGLEELESDVLGAGRTDAFFASLGLIVAEDVDRFTGVREMHLHMVMRRVWALLDTLHHAPYPAVLLATVGPSASGMEAWARHVLAAPMRVFDRDGAPRLTQALLRRRDMADAHGEAISIETIMAACEEAALPWHLRRAGDTARHVVRAETELGQLRRHHKSDPLDAEVVLLEGTYPDVRREAERLAHAGRRTERGSVVIVMAPPTDEEMVLHEEAADAPNRARIDALPRAISLAEPDVVRQRHLDRALGREQHVAALEARFGAELTDALLSRLEEKRRIRYRDLWYFDPRADDAAVKRMVRAAGETALGEPIRGDCVSESADRVALVDRGTSEVLLEVDRAIAAALHPPGTIFEHPRGRYAVMGLEGSRATRDAQHASLGGRSPQGSIACEQVSEPHRTTPDREVRIEAEAIAFEARELGGAPVRVAFADARVEESTHGVRRYGPDLKLIEHRRYKEPVSASYSTEVCAVALDGCEDLAARVPLAAALRLVLPCALRGSRDLIDAALADVAGEPCLVFFDRTPGSSGFARAVSEGSLAELLTLARLALERLVGPVQRHLHHRHDTTHAPELEAWDAGAALAWLDRALDAPPELEAEAAEELGRRVEYTEGEGRGDLGRLWISSTGRTDDLVWTRHRWKSAHELGGQPAGLVFLDVAVERRTIAWAIRKATIAGASATPVKEIRDPAQWMQVHQAALSTASGDLAAFYERLYRLAGAQLTDTVLALVSAIPTHPSPIAPAERAPIAVLARRRADRDAKVLLAWALVPSAQRPTVRMTEAGPVLQIVRDGKEEVVDLSGGAIKTLTGDTGAALALSWGEDAPPEQALAADEAAAEAEADPESAA